MVKIWRRTTDKAKKLLGRAGLFDGLLLDWEIRSLQRYKAAVWRQFDEEVKALKIADPRERYNEENAIFSQYAGESDLYDDEMQQITSKYFMRKAERLLIPTPPFSKKGPEWAESSVTGLYRLSPEALHALRSRVRAEQKERRDVVFMWLAAVTGIIGALTGLASILLS